MESHLTYSKPKRITEEIYLLAPNLYLLVDTSTKAYYGSANLRRFGSTPRNSPRPFWVISDTGSARLVYSYSFGREDIGFSFRTDMHHGKEHIDIVTYLKGEPGATLEHLRLDPEGKELKLIRDKKI
jgi:hypothetical protein